MSARMTVEAVYYRDDWYLADTSMGRLDPLVPILIEDQLHHLGLDGWRVVRHEMLANPYADGVETGPGRVYHLRRS